MSRFIPLMVLALMVVALPANAQTTPAGLTLETLTTSFQAPNDLDFLADGRMLVAQRTGAIRIRTAAGAIGTVGTQGGVSTSSEEGLLSVCRHPNFATNGHIYVWYARGSSMTLTRWQCTGDLSNPNSTSVNMTNERRLYNANNSAFNHNGGSVRFGNDGMLYLSYGEDADPCGAQSLSQQKGKLLRIDVDSVAAGGSLSVPSAASMAPADNPTPGSLFFAYGLRNPVRMDYDSVSNNLYIADVGGNHGASREEFNEIQAGGGQPLRNMGWPWREGVNSGPFSCSGGIPSGMIGPIVDVARSQGWTSGMVAFRYRNQSGPFDLGAAFEGHFFYCDYFAGQIRRLQRVGGNWQTIAGNWSTGWSGITSMRQGPDGAIYITQHAGTYSFGNGSLKRIRGTANLPKTVVISGAGQFARAGDPFPNPVVFEARDSAGNPDPGVTVNFAVGGPGTLGSTSAVADGSGRVQVNVTATNLSGLFSDIAVTGIHSGGDPAGTDAIVNRRKLTITYIDGSTVSDILVVQIANGSPAASPSIPYMVTLSAAGTPPLNTFIGLVDPNPFDAGSFVFEDAFGIFNGGFSANPLGYPMGTPSATRVYSNIPEDALVGLSLKWQAIGYEPASGGFHATNTESTIF